MSEPSIFATGAEPVGAVRGVRRDVLTEERVEPLGLLLGWEQLLPVRWETVQVSLRDAFKIRRIYRKLAKRRSSGSLRHITVFVRYENVVRLLEYLRYRQEE